MENQPLNLKETLKANPDRWVAVDRTFTKIVDSSNSLDELKAKTAGMDVVYMSNLSQSSKERLKKEMQDGTSPFLNPQKGE